MRKQSLKQSVYEMQMKLLRLQREYVQRHAEYELDELEVM